MPLTLAIDTASPAPAVALADGDAAFEEALPGDRRASEDLLPAIERLLSRAGRRLSDCERIAVCAGPGSFTGLRIGLATAWAVGRALSVPVEAVATLEAMAEAHRASGASDVLAALDAGRGETSAAVYDLRGSRAREVSPLGRYPAGEVRAIAPGAALVALPAGLLPQARAPLGSLAVGLALAVARAPGAGARALSPIYSRPSAAEEKHGSAPA